jgi:hypothetical protein
MSECVLSCPAENTSVALEADIAACRPDNADRQGPIRIEAGYSK